MSGIYIRGVSIPRDRAIIIAIDAGDVWLRTAGNPHWKHSDAFAVELILTGQILRVLKTERECVSRDCDRNCGACDLSLDRAEILSAYDALIDLLEAPGDKEAEG